MVRSTSTIETNGPANILMMLMILRDAGNISEDQYEILAKQCRKTVNYLVQLENPTGIYWHEVSDE